MRLWSAPDFCPAAYTLATHFNRWLELIRHVDLLCCHWSFWARQSSPLCRIIIGAWAWQILFAVVSCISYFYNHALEEVQWRDLRGVWSCMLDYRLCLFPRLLLNLIWRGDRRLDAEHGGGAFQLIKGETSRCSISSDDGG